MGSGFEEVLNLDETDLSRYSTADDPKTPNEVISMGKERDMLHLKSDDGKPWYRPSTLDQLSQLQRDLVDFDIFAGGTGFYRPPSHLIPIVQVSGIPDLKRVSWSQKEMRIGACVTLSHLKNSIASKMLPNTGKEARYLLEALQKSLDKLGSPQVRNAATVGGSIIWGVSCPDSDLIPIYLATGSRVKILLKDGSATVWKVNDLLEKRLPKKAMIEELILPLPSEGVITAFYRRGKRKEFCLPVANACIQALVEDGIVVDASVAFGGATPDVPGSKKPVPRLETELMAALKGKKINEIDRNWLRTAVSKSGARQGPNREGEIYNEEQFASFLSNFFHGNLLKDAEGIKPGTRSSVLSYQKPDDKQPYWDPVTRPVPNLWAAEQACGTAIYVDDIAPTANEIQLVLVQSVKAHAKVSSMDFSEAIKVEGVIGVVSREDISKERNVWGLIVKDEPVFAGEEVTHFGQVIAAIACETLKAGRMARKLVKIEYEDLPTILSIQEARENESFLGQLEMKRNQIQGAAATGSVKTVKGSVHLGGQDHYYMETHGALVVPSGEKDEMTVYCTTQEPMPVQGMVSHVLGIARHKITVKAKRTGGAFGGKERMQVALIAAVAARKFQRPARLILIRREDMAITGHKHELQAEYEADYDDACGRLLRVQMRLFANGGNSTDLSMVWSLILLARADGGYTFHNFDGEATACSTNTVSNTAFRGFGGPEGAIVAETILDHIAHETGMDPIELREAHLTKDGDKMYFGGPNEAFKGVTLRQCWDECKKRSNYEERRKAVDEFNRQVGPVKRGLALVPMKFPVTMGVKSVQQGAALIRVYLDGSVLVSHGGSEMGQGLNTKMMQVASRALGIPLEKIHILETSTDTVPNASPTGGSCGADLNGPAIIDACSSIKKRLEPYLEKGLSWDEAVSTAHGDRVNLSAVGFFGTSGVSFAWDPGEI